MWPDYRLEWDATPLEKVAHAIATDIMRGLRQRELRTQRHPQWRESLAALDLLFGKLTSAHFLAMPPITWGVVLTEPQITQGWRHFLDPAVCSDQVARHRCAAFLSALAKGSGRASWVAPEDLLELKVDAEVHAQRIRKTRYIDLLLSWVSASGERKATAVEFKFGHHLSKHQLPDYQVSLQNMFKAEHLNMYVVLATVRPRDAHSLKRNPGWRFTTWHSLLRALGVLMPVEGDGDDFRQFRSTVWKRAGQ